MNHWNSNKRSKIDLLEISFKNLEINAEEKRDSSVAQKNKLEEHAVDAMNIFDPKRDSQDFNTIKSANRINDNYQNEMDELCDIERQFQQWLSAERIFMKDEAFQLLHRSHSLQRKFCSEFENDPPVQEKENIFSVSNRVNNLVVSIQDAIIKCEGEHSAQPEMLVNSFNIQQSTSTTEAHFERKSFKKKRVNYSPVTSNVLTDTMNVSEDFNAIIIKIECDIKTTREKYEQWITEGSLLSENEALQILNKAKEHESLINKLMKSKIRRKDKIKLDEMKRIVASLIPLIQTAVMTGNSNDIFVSNTETQFENILERLNSSEPQKQTMFSSQKLNKVKSRVRPKKVIFEGGEFRENSPKTTKEPEKRIFENKYEPILFRSRQNSAQHSDSSLLKTMMKTKIQALFSGINQQQRQELRGDLNSSLNGQPQFASKTNLRSELNDLDRKMIFSNDVSSLGLSEEDFSGTESMPTYLKYNSIKESHADRAESLFDSNSFNFNLKEESSKENFGAVESSFPLNLSNKHEDHQEKRTYTSPAVSMSVPVTKITNTNPKKPKKKNERKGASTIETKNTEFNVAEDLRIQKQDRGKNKSKNKIKAKKLNLPNAGTEMNEYQKQEFPQDSDIFLNDQSLFLSKTCLEEKGVIRENSYFKTPRQTCVQTIRTKLFPGLIDMLSNFDEWTAKNLTQSIVEFLDAKDSHGQTSANLKSIEDNNNSAKSKNTFDETDEVVMKATDDITRTELAMNDTLSNARNPSDLSQSVERTSELIKFLFPSL